MFLISSGCYTTANIEQIDALISKVKELDTRLDDTECTSADQLIKFEDEVVMDVETIKDTSKTFDKHLHSLDDRVSSIEHLCGIRSSSSSTGLDTSRDDLSVDTFSISSTTSADDMDMSISSDSSCVESDTEESRGDESQEDTPPPDSSHLPIGPTPDSSLQVPNNRREDVATELHYQHANEGLQDPIPIEVIMSLLEEHDDDAVATLRHMRSLESEYDEDDAAAVGSDFTDESSSDEESFCFSMMDDDDDDDDDDGEEEDDYDSSTSDDDELLDKSTLALLEANRSSPNHPIHSFKPEDMLLFDKSDRKKPRKKKSANKPKCIVFGCTSNAVKNRLKCSRHEYPCSFSGCNKWGKVVSDNGRYCYRHAQTEAPEAYAQYRERENRCYKENYRTNIKFRLRVLVRSRLHTALKAQDTSYQGKNKLLGCSAGQFKRYLEQFFREPGNRWMNWDNQGRPDGQRGWDMDHIYPLSELDLTDPEQLRRAAHWSNFQPLSAADNNDKYTDIPVGFEWNGDRWMWSKASGHTNYDLPE